MIIGTDLIRYTRTSITTSCATTTLLPSLVILSIMPALRPHCTRRLRAIFCGATLARRCQCAAALHAVALLVRAATFWRRYSGSARPTARCRSPSLRAAPFIITGRAWTPVFYRSSMPAVPAPPPPGAVLPAPRGSLGLFSSCVVLSLLAVLPYFPVMRIPPFWFGHATRGPGGRGQAPAHQRQATGSTLLAFSSLTCPTPPQVVRTCWALALRYTWPWRHALLPYTAPRCATSPTTIIPHSLRITCVSLQHALTQPHRLRGMGLHRPLRAFYIRLSRFHARMPISGLPFSIRLPSVVRLFVSLGDPGGVYLVAGTTGRRWRLGGRPRASHPPTPLLLRLTITAYRRVRRPTCPQTQVTHYGRWDLLDRTCWSLRWAGATSNDRRFALSPVSHLYAKT